MVNTIKFLDKIVALHLINKLPNEYTFYETKESREYKFGYLKHIGSSGVTPIKLPNTPDGVEVDYFNYAGFKFHIIILDEWNG